MEQYGQEWQISEDPILPGTLDICRQFVEQRYPGCEITATMAMGASEDGHKWMKCRSKKPHSHIYVKWSWDPDA